MTPSEEDEYWLAQIASARRGQLDTVRRAAAGWTALFTAVLGIFGSVSFISGSIGLEDLDDGTRTLVRILILAAAIATLAATLLAGSAAGTFPRVSSNLTVDAFRDASRRAARFSLARLRAAMWCGGVAALVVMAGAITVLFSDVKVPSDQSVLVVTPTSAPVCGALESDGSGRLTVKGIDIGSATEIVLVGDCGKGS